MPGSQIKFGLIVSRGEIVSGPPFTDGLVPEYGKDPVRWRDGEVCRAYAVIKLRVEEPLIRVGVCPTPCPRYGFVVLYPHPDEQGIPGAAIHSETSRNETSIKCPLVLEVD